MKIDELIKIVIIDRSCTKQISRMLDSLLRLSKVEVKV